MKPLPLLAVLTIAAIAPTSCNPASANGYYDPSNPNETRIEMQRRERVVRRIRQIQARLRQIRTRLRQVSEGWDEEIAKSPNELTQRNMRLQSEGGELVGEELKLLAELEKLQSERW